MFHPRSLKAVRYKKIGYNIKAMRQTACLVVDPIKIDSFAYLFNCTTVGRTSDWVTVQSWTWLGDGAGGWWLTPFPLGLSWFGWWVSFAPGFRCCCFCGSSCLFCLGFGFCVSGMVRLWVGGLPRGAGSWVSGGPGRSLGRGLVDRGLVGAPRWFLLLAVPGRLFCFGSLVVLGVARCYLWLFALCVDVEVGEDGC